MNVLLSIKPKYVKEIEEGAKLYEFRKSIFKQVKNRMLDVSWLYCENFVKQ